MMMKAAEMAGTGSLPGNGGHSGSTITQEQLLERAKNLRTLSEMAAARGTRITVSCFVLYFFAFFVFSYLIIQVESDYRI